MELLEANNTPKWGEKILASNNKEHWGEYYFFGMGDNCVIVMSDEGYQKEVDYFKRIQSEIDKQPPKPGDRVKVIPGRGRTAYSGVYVGKGDGDVYIIDNSDYDFPKRLNPKQGIMAVLRRIYIVDGKPMDLDPDQYATLEKYFADNGKCVIR